MLEALDCPHCGAPLDIPEGVTRLKCRYCASTLELRENESVRALVLLQAGLQRVESRVADVASGVQVLQGQAAEIVQHTAALAGRVDQARASWEARVAKVHKQRRSAQAVGFFLALVGMLGMIAAMALLSGAGRGQEGGEVPVCFGAVALLSLLAGLSHANQAGRKAKEQLAQLEMARPW